MESIRKFEDVEAVRGKVPFSFGIAGATGSGKTYSALRVATGMQSVLGGDIHVIDTEAKRALKYQKYFKFRHVPFVPPHGPLDYLRVVQHCAYKGASVIVIDSMSHEHEGDGGVGALHTDALAQLMKRYPNSTEEKQGATAWRVAKKPRREMITGLTQVDAVLIYCFRAQEKTFPVKLGWCPIGGREIFYEIDALCMLPPDADGAAWWGNSQGERSGMKPIPKQFRALFNQGEQLSEDLGASMARWSLGGPMTVHETVLDVMENASTLDELMAAVPMVKEAKERKTITPGEWRGLQDRFLALRAYLVRGDGFESDEQAAEAKARESAFSAASSPQDAPAKPVAASAPIATDTPAGEPPLGVLEGDPKP